MTAETVAPTSDSLARAADILRDGGLVAIPTETVYGLACDAANAEAVARLYAAKGRPSFNPLIAHVSNIQMAEREGHFSDSARDLAAKHWPGPLTLVLPLADTHIVCDLARAGLSSIAVRMPAHTVARDLLTQFDKPIVAPSANPSGRISPTRAEHVAADMADKVDLILDGGPCSVGLESTILSCLMDPPSLLRPGSIDASKFSEGETNQDAPISPGQLSRHYSPNAALRLNANDHQNDEALLGFGQNQRATLNLSPSGDLKEAAANLFAMLRELDRSHNRIAVAPIPNSGLGAAINDRLARAAKRD